MSAAAEMLKISEAAVVLNVDARAVNRVIDDDILPKEFVSVDDGRHVLGAACAMVLFYFETADRLTSAERKRVIDLMRERVREPDKKIEDYMSRLRVHWHVHAGDFITINLKPIFETTLAGLKHLEDARAIVISDPMILSGTPIIKGTRVPVYDVAASAEAGIPTERILKAYPSLTAEKIDLARIFARANPLRGRPRDDGSRLTGTNLVSEHRIKRRKKPPA